MKTLKRRGLLAKAGALLAVAALAFGASPSYAQTVVTPTESDVIITKLEQGAGVNAEATGKPLDTAPNPIDGVTYQAYEVPLTKTSGSNEWQAEIAGITLEQAKTKLGTSPAVAYTGVTGTDTNPTGQVRWTMDRGLYLVRETSTPAGVVASPDFLVAVPMTDPGEPTKWLDEIYIYPKSDKVSAAMTVDNAADYSVGNTVTWTIKADIPQIRDTVDNDFLPTDKFEIVANFDSAGLLINEDDITIPGLTLKTHYDVDVDTTTTPGTTIVTVTLTDGGRDELVSLLDGGTSTIDVKVDAAVVQTVGEFTPTATIFAGSTDATGKAVDTSLAGVKYGKVTLTKKDQNDQLAKDAVFRVYTSETDAVAKNINFLKTALNSDGQWTTREDGTVILDGFRFSDYANGVTQVDEDGSLYQTYWLVEMTAPEGQQLLAEPISFAVTAVDTPLEVTNTANTNAFVLPLTGGTGTAMLTILGLGILAIVLFVARSRRNAEA